MKECPFSWVSQKEGCMGSTNVWKPVKCRGELCQLWSGSDCVFNTHATILNAIYKQNISND
jgi:hypothetical protein